jgi:hypothetical protein
MNGSGNLRFWSPFNFSGIFEIQPVLALARGWLYKQWSVFFAFSVEYTISKF